MEIKLTPVAAEKLLLVQAFEWQLGLLMDVLEETHGITIDRERAIRGVKDRIAKQRREHFMRAVGKGPHEDPGR